MDSHRRAVPTDRSGERPSDPVGEVVDWLITSGRPLADLPDQVGAEPDSRYPDRDRTAVLAAMAARYLVDGAVITAAVIGTPGRVWRHTRAVGRYVPGVSQISVCLTDSAAQGDEEMDRVPADVPALSAELVAAGIGLTGVRSAAEAAYGANLVVIAGPTAVSAEGRPTGTEDRLLRLMRGALVVNVSGGPPSKRVLQQVATVLVDDLTLLPQGQPSRWTATTCGRSRTLPILGDLRQVICGENVREAQSDQTLLVDLLRTAVAGSPERALPPPR